MLLLYWHFSIKSMPANLLVFVSLPCSDPGFQMTRSPANLRWTICSGGSRMSSGASSKVVEVVLWLNHLDESTSPSSRLICAMMNWRPGLVLIQIGDSCVGICQSGPLWSTLDHFGLFWAVWALCVMLGHFGPSWAAWITLEHSGLFGPFGVVWTIWGRLAHFERFGHFGPFGPFGLL